MFAVIQIGSSQYKVSLGDVIVVQKLNYPINTEINLTDVLLVGDKETTTLIKQDNVENNSVTVKARILEQTKAPKVDIFKRKRRKHQKKRLTHSQNLTVLHITGISIEN